MPALTWIGKDKIVNHDRAVPFRLLKKNKKLSLGKSENLIVEGDNLEALKALMPFYYGKVKCIYIDPPYNTGNEKWVYNDKVNAPKIKEWLGKVVGAEGEDLTRHDKWLCLMYPRLKLLRDLLREDGVIFISIDDNEQHNLRFLMDEIFGEENFIASIIWEGALKNDSKFISVSHDYVVCYARNKDKLKSNNTVWRSRKEAIDEIYEAAKRFKNKYKDDYGAISNELKKWYKEKGKSHPAWQHRHYNKVDKKGIYFPSDISWPGGGGPKYKVFHPVTRKPVSVPARGWVYPSPERMQKAIAEDLVDFGEDESKVPTLKRYLHQTEGQVLPSVIYQDRRAAMQRLRLILGGDFFENPKDENVIKRLIEATTDKKDIILDSFAGSGTTGHAVLGLNKEDGGNRQFILVELENKIARDITAERVRRVAKGYAYKNSKGEKVNVPGLGGGFEYVELGEPLFGSDGLINPAVSFTDMARYVYFTETHTNLDIKKIKQNYIGELGSTQYFLLFNGLGKKNILDRTFLTKLKPITGQKMVYADKCLVDEDKLEKFDVVFKQIPYQVKVY